MLLPVAALAAEQPSPTALPPDKTVVSKHTVSVDGRQLAYAATAGVLPIDAPSLPQARIFYVSYELDGADPATRPVTFVFNGGPGAASAYLHLGAMGPKRAVLNDDGSMPPPPAKLADNESTWLGLTDLVFIDPVGTGYSRAVSKKEDKDGERDSDGTFFAPREDSETLARFIRLYLTRTNRWLAPKFLVGESYGGFRAALLLDSLPGSAGVAINGAVLISPVLQFALIRPDSYDVLAWALKFPSLAAVAAHHRKSSLAANGGTIDRAQLAEVEAWSLERYLPGLARNDSDGESSTALADMAAAYTGMPREAVRRRHGFVPSSEFAKNLLHGDRRIVSLYDGALTFVDEDPESSSPSGNDRTLDRLNTVLTPTFNAYVKDELKFETELPYVVLNQDVNRQWRWGGRGQGWPGAADNLKSALTENTRLQVVIAHGLYDLVTPYYVSAYVMAQMRLDPRIRDNLVLTTYAAGHMMYTHSDARAQLLKDAKAMYARALAPLSDKPVR